ncbi:Pheromone-regulated membrane protein 10 [Grifola frondosa]|uniref:Pheromone-regulated membrane protein 10 n=1 Tax=Grifola frondosa TaxID=5627 RepID=A0A1C7MGS7_GRIFR|nr:Pheromone-regulated membrane protein 10 [Grifola frondosa]
MPYTNIPPRRSSLARRSSLSTPESRRGSRVHFDDNDYIVPPSGYPQDSSQDRSPRASQTFPRSGQPYATGDSSLPQWNFPAYQNNYPAARLANQRANQDIPPHMMYPSDRSRDYNHLSLPPTGSVYDNSGSANPDSEDDSRRPSDASSSTLFDEAGRYAEDDSRYSMSSYRHPYDIKPPADAYSRSQPYHRGSGRPNQSTNSADEDEDRDDQTDVGDEGCNLGSRDDRRRGVLANMIDLYADNYARRNRDDDDSSESMSRMNSYTPSAISSQPWNLRRRDSAASNNSQVIDPDDPTVTGERKAQLDDPEDIEKACMRQMSYKARRKLRQRIRIEFNITSVLNRQKFLMRLAKALMTFGAPSHRIESQLLSAARILEVDAEFIHIPGVIICSFGDQETKTSEMHFVKCGGRLALGSLHDVHQIYRSVVHDEISARKATVLLDALLDAEPLYGRLIRTSLAFCLSALICPLAFGGSFLDMWIAGSGATFLSLMQFCVASKSQLYANVFEISVTIIISFLARGLSSIRSQIFCYTAISSAGIVGILPGYLILSSSLELASKNIVCGSVKMVYALIYTLFLGFGLQIGSDFYLLFDQGARHELAALAARMTGAVSISGTFASDNGTFSDINSGNPLVGTFTFTNSTPYLREHILLGCYRPPSFPWYLQPFPWWAQFFIVPMFSIMSSLANLQPIWTWELVVMVVISCVSYAANKIANHFIFNRSDVVSAIGAFAVGLLGNIYSRKMGGTAFTSMVTGVLFLVPSGLSQAGGITAQGNGIDIGGAMIAVTIGITVGLFMSQALVYMFGSRKNAAIFSF